MGFKWRLVERRKTSSVGETIHFGHRKWVPKADYRKSPLDPKAKELVADAYDHDVIVELFDVQSPVYVVDKDFIANGISLNV